MQRRTASYDKSCVGSSASGLKSEILRKGGLGADARRVRAIATTLAVVARAMNCGLTAAEARSIAVCNVEVAAATLVDPDRKDAILAAAAKATTRIVERALRRAA